MSYTYPRFLRRYQSDQAAQKSEEFRKFISDKPVDISDSTISSDRQRDIILKERFFGAIRDGNNGITALPIYLVSMGDQNIFSMSDGLDQAISMFKRQHVQTMQYLMSMNPETEQFISLVNLKGVSLSHISMSSLDLLRSTLNFDDTYYPETAKQVYIFNSPSMMPLMWKSVKPLMSQSLSQRIQFVDKEQLIQIIPQVRLYPALYQELVN